MFDKTLPVLDPDDYPTDMFVDDLAVWCNKWVDDVAFPVMRQASTLYDDPAVRLLVRRHATLKRKHEGDRLDALIKTGQNPDAFVSRTYGLWDSDRASIDEALRFLLIPTDKED